MISDFVANLSKRIDSFLMGCIFFACIIGLFVIYSASGQDWSRVLSQFINMMVALTLMWAVANITPHCSFLAYCCCLALLCLVKLVMGHADG